MRSTERTHYQVLGITRTASLVEIRRAHRQLAYLLHPDRQSGATPAERRLAERRMREVNVAWTTLSDPVGKADYDRSLERTTRSPGVTDAPGSHGAAPSEEPDSLSGAWWDSDDPEAAFARLHASDDDPDDPDLPALGFWMLRRGPVVVVLVVGLLIFVVTAYAGRGISRVPTTSVAPAVAANSNCVRFMQDHMAYTVSCEGAHDATITREEPDAQACTRDGFDYAVVGSRSVCVERP